MEGRYKGVGEAGWKELNMNNCAEWNNMYNDVLVEIRVEQHVQ